MSSSAPPPVVRWRTDFDKFVVTSNFERRGWRRWEERSDEDWNVFWANVHTVREIFNPDNGIRLGEHQLVNHFPNHHELTRKDLMVKNMKRYRKELEKRCKERGEDPASASRATDFLPLTFSLPADYALFAEEFRRVQRAGAKHATWIVKPTGKAQGKGIFLINKLAQLRRFAPGGGAPEPPSAGGRPGGDPRARRGDDARGDDARRHPRGGVDASPHVVSRYVSNPLLIGGKKFDLRVYVVVTRFRPLRAYISRLGFARFCNVKYSSAPDDLENPYVHLTNVAVQRKHREYNHKHGNKWSLANLRLYLDAARGAKATDAMFASINEAIAHSLRSVQNAVVNDRRCFEVYGYDMLVDDDLKPWLVEVNASPSLSATTESDRALKTRVIRDALEVAAPAGWLEARQAEFEAKRAGGVPGGGASSLVHGGGASWSRREPTWRTEGGVPASVAGSLDVLVDDAADELRERREREREGAKEARGGERVVGFGSSGRGRGPTR